LKRSGMQEALRLLGQRAYSRWGMSEALRRRGYAEAEIAECLERLTDWGYIKDDEFARDRIAHYRNKGKGREYVFGRLLENGLPEEDIRRYLEEWYPWTEEYRLARQIAEKRLSQTENPSRKEKMRVLRYLAQSGFTEEAIRACGYAEEDT